MFLEPHFKRSGWIEVICGSMFSGKTEELLRRLRRAKIANQKVVIFKPALDNRYATHKVVSHDANSLEAVPVVDSQQLMNLAGGYDVIGVDEAQFFDAELVQTVQQLALDGCRVIIAGLDMDFRGQPFGPIPQLLAVAEYITKLHAICQQCGHLATHSFRLSANEETIELGAQQTYEARCRSCYAEGEKKQKEVGAQG